MYPQPTRSLDSYVEQHTLHLHFLLCCKADFISAISSKGSRQNERVVGCLSMSQTVETTGHATESSAFSVSTVPNAWTAHISSPWNTHREQGRKTAEFSCWQPRFTTGLRLARDPRAGSKTERVIDAVEDGIFLANQIYEKALLRFGQGNIDFKW